LKNNLFCRVLHDAEQTGTAVAAVNILNHITAEAVVKAAENVMRPIILQPSMGTVRRYGPTAFARMVQSVREESCVSVVLHLDHCTDEKLARECVRVGWDSVMMDYSSRPFAENVALTRQMVDYAHTHNVAVEGEIGVISGVEDNITNKRSNLASFEETLNYMEKSGIDAVAPAIGTAHGVYTGPPELNYALVEKLGHRYVPVVVHGGSGLPEEDFTKLITCGASKINLSTVLKQAYLGAARRALEDDKITPLAFDQKVEDACRARIEAFIRLFAGEEVKVYAS
jgi:fructose-bisphosphate aldolase class II